MLNEINIRRTWIFLFAATLLMPKGSFAASSSLTSPKINHLIAEKGAKAALQELWEKPSTWDTVLLGIASGTPEWLGIAAQFLPVSDAGATYALENALGEAVDVHPSEALKFIIAHPLITKGGCEKEAKNKKDLQACLHYATLENNINGNCGCIPDDEDRFGTLRRFVNEINRREKSLAKVQETSLQAAKNACIKSLEQSRLAAKTSFRHVKLLGGGVPGPDVGHSSRGPGSGLDIGHSSKPINRENRKEH